MISPVKNLFIASQVRSGSTWVGERVAYFLERHCNQIAFGLTMESFRDLQVDSDAKQVNAIFDTLWCDPTGLATCKMQCASLSVIYRESLSSPEDEERFFGPKTAWIVLRRKDPLRQAVSLAAARKSTQHHHCGQAESGAAIEHDHEEINDALGAIKSYPMKTLLGKACWRLPASKPKARHKSRQLQAHWHIRWQR